MALYFFDVVTDGEIVRDLHGDELADVEEVRDLVTALLLRMAEEQIGDADHHDVTISARNADGGLVYKASLVFDGLRGTGQ